MASRSPCNPTRTVRGFGSRMSRGSSTLRKFAKGLRLELRTDEPATIDARLVATARRVEFARISTDRVRANVLLAERTLRVEAGERGLRLNPDQRALGRADELKVELRVAATDAAGNRTVRERKISVG